MNRALIFVIIRILVVRYHANHAARIQLGGIRAALAFRDGKLINSGISTGRNRIKAWESEHSGGWERGEKGVRKWRGETGKGNFTLELRHLKAYRVEKLPPELILWKFLAGKKGSPMETGNGGRKWENRRFEWMSFGHPYSRRGKWWSKSWRISFSMICLKKKILCLILCTIRNEWMVDNVMIIIQRGKI